MTRLLRVAALVGLAAVVASCAGVGTTTFKGTAYDVYATIPSLEDVRTLLGDGNWWADVPSFQVSPLDSGSAPVNEKFAVSQRYIHVGSAEEMLVRYTVYDKTSSASTVMSDYQNAYPNAPTSPKAGDQVIYLGLSGPDAAPYLTRTIVRSGQVVTQIAWSRKDGVPSVKQLARNASKFVDGLKNLGKVHSNLRRVDESLLPPPGLDITELGSAAGLPIETFVVMSLAGLPDTVAALLRQNGVSTFDYADYALNSDTHMEVQAALLTFPSAAAATDWANTFAPGTPDSNGISSAYIPTGGSPAAGVYHYVFSSGKYGGYLVCRATIDSEAASRECEDPMGKTALAWKAGLGGIR